MNDLTTRQQLAEARIMLRDAEDTHRYAQAEAEARIVAAAGDPKKLGCNAEDRARALLLGLKDDALYQAARMLVRRCQADVDRAQAQVDDEIDLRRMLDRASRDRLSTALEAVSIHAEERHSAITIVATPQAA